MIEILNGIVEIVDYQRGLMNGVKLYHNVETEAYPVHWHTAMEIIMPIVNDYRVEIGGIETTVGEGDIFIIPPGELHILQAPATGERIILLLDYSMICNLSGMDSLLHMLHPFKLISREKNPREAEALSKLIFGIEKEYFSGEAYREASIYSMMINFFVELGRSSLSTENMFPNITTNKQHEYVEKFMSVCNYISEHCTDNITVEELADIAGFSRFHFARLFKQFANMSYYDYITQKRIAHAEKLLIIPDISITEVAMQSGFNSLSTFNRVFKAVKKCTPSEYKGLNTTMTQKPVKLEQKAVAV